MQLLIRADGSGLAWRDVNADAEQLDFDVTLPPAGEARGRLVTSEGRPAAGVAILVNSLGDFSKGQVSGVDSMRAALPPDVWPRDVVTDAEGRYAVTGIAPGVDVSLYAAQEPFAPHWWIWKAADKSDHTEVLSPAQMITGVVVAADTGKPLAHARLTAFQGWDPKRGGMAGVDGQADADGRFRLNPYAAGSYVVSAFAPDGLPYLARKMEFEWPAAAAEHELRVELSRGVLVHGKIVEEVSGQPIAGASVRYEPRVLNQRDTDDLVTGWQATSVSDDGGNYAIAVPPGPGYITVLCPGGRYVVQPTTNSFLREGKPGGRRVYLHAYKTFDLEPDAKEQIFDLKVTRGSTVDTHVVGPDGKIPERLLMIYQGLQAPWSESFGDNPQVVPGGRVEIGSVPPDGELTVYLLDPVRKNGRVVNLRGKDAGKPQNIELLPCGSASLRFVDGKGNPVPGVDKLGLNMVFTPGTTVFEMTAEKPMADETYVANFDRLNHWHLIGEGGLIDYQALIPGVDYQLFGSDASGKPGVERVFRVQPGEHQQLKDYVIRDQDVLDRAEDVWREKQKAKAAEQEQALNDKSPPDDDLLVVRGQVVDPAGKPFVGADVVAVRWYWQNQDPGVPLAKTTSNAAGEFEISFRKSQFDVQANNPHQWRYASIAATAPGHGVGWIFYNDVEPGQRATLKLVEDQPITGRIVDLEGNPVAGATLHIQSIYRNDNDDLSRWIDALRGGISYFGSEDFGRPDRALPTASFEFCKPVRTDEDGRFRVSGFGRSRYVSLNLIGPRIAVSDLRVVSAPVEPFTIDYSQHSFKNTTPCYGANFQFSAEPSQPIEGVVRDARSKQPLPGVRVVADRLAGTNLNGVYATETLSDAEGRYRLDGMPKGEGNGILAIPGDDQPYFMREIEVPTAPGFEPVKFDIELHRGIWITGRLSEKDTAAPIQARMHYLPWPDNPHIKDLPEFNDGHLQGSQMRYEAGGDGRFKLVGLPGRGLVAAVCTKKPYPPGQGVREIADLPKRDQFRKVVGVFAPTELFPTAVHEIRPAEDAAEIDVDFRLDPGARLKVRFVDPRGNPLTNLWIRGLWPRTPVYVAENAGPEAEVLALRPDEKRLLLVLDKERRLGKAVEVSLADAKDGLLTITLEPCATVKARLLDQNGEPARGATVRIVPTSENDFSVDLPEVATDENGILNNAAVPSGCRYQISCSSPEIEYQTVAKDLAVAPGETVDLGEFDVTSEERPEPKRTAAAAGPKSEQSGSTQSKPDDAVVVRGRVVDPDGKPVSGADVWAIHPRRDGEAKLPPARTQSDATGQFVLRFTGIPADGENGDAWRMPRIVAMAKSFGPGWVEYDESQADKPITLRLVTDEPIAGRIVDLEGRRVAGALVTVRAISRNESEDLTTWLDALRKGETYRSATFTNGRQLAAPQDELVGDVPQIFETVKTDADGAFRIVGVGRQRCAALKLSGAGIVSTELAAVTVPMDSLTVRFGNPEPYFERDITIFGSKFQYAAEPSQPITGKVVDAKTHAPLAGVRLIAKKLAGKRMSEYGQTPIVSDERGAFRLDGMPRGEGNLILASPTAGQPYFVRELEVPVGSGLEAVQFDVELHRGVPIHGRVINKATGQPVDATVRYVPWPDNPHLEPTQFKPAIYSPTYPETDRDGRFELVGMPGQGLILIECRSEPFPSGQGLEALGNLTGEAFRDVSGGNPPSKTYPTAVHRVEIGETDTEVSADVVLEPGASVDLQIVDSQRQPLSGLNIRGLWPVAAGYRGKDLPSNVQVRALAPAEKRWVFIHHPGRNLGRAIEVDAQTAGRDPLRVVLEPCGTVTARLLDKNGEGVRTGYVSFGILLPDSWGLELTEGHTDQDGRLRCDAILPGGKYNISVASPQTNWQSVAKDLAVAPGETVDLGEFDVTSEERPEPKRTFAKPPGREAAAPSAAPEANALLIRGTVLDPDGKPLAGADVKLIRTPRAPWAKGFPTPEATSDKEGRFAFELPKSRYEGLRSTRPWPFVMVVATAPGYAPSYAPYEQDRAGTEPVIRLAANAPIEGRIVDLEGRPVPHVRVRVTGISTNVKSDPTAWIEALRAGTPHRAVPHEHRLNMGLSSDVDQPGNKTETDDDGRFRITAVGRGRLATLSIWGGGIVATDVDVVNWPIEPLTTNVAEAGTIMKTFYGSKFQIAAEPSQPIEGVVRDADSGEPLSGIRIHGRRMAGKRWAGYPPPEAVSDEQARYRLEGMPKGEGNTLEAVPADGQPYFVREFDVPTAREFEPVKFDLELHRGILVRGRVRDKVTGEPVKAKVLYLPWPDNPNIKGLVEFTSGRLMGDEHRYRTDDEGRFTLVGLPGRGLLSVIHVDDQPYPTGQGFDLLPDLEANRLAFRQISQLYVPDAKWMVAIKEIRPAEEDAEFAADIELEPGGTVKLRVVDEAGQPVSGVTMGGTWPNRMSHVELKVGPEIEAVGFKPGEARWIICCELERNLGRALRVSLGDDASGPVPVVLEPCATIQGRLVDEDGKPLEGVQVSFHIAGERVGTAAAGPVRTDKDGRFVNKLIFPGTEYDVTFEDDQSRDRSIAKKLAVAPGETIDLGQLDVTSDERPEPKRTAAKQRAAQSAAKPPSTQADEGAAADPADRFQFAGNVVGPDDKPVAGAKIFVLYYTPNRIETKPRAESNADGSFEFTMTNEDFDTGEMNAPWEGAKVVAVAPGYGAAWALAAGLEKSGQMMKTLRAKGNFSPARAHISTDSTLRLVADDVPIEGRIVNLEGQPVAGADLQVIELHGDTENSLDAWLDAVQNKNASFYEARERLFGGFSGTHAQHQLAQLFPKVVTDAEGRFRIRGVGRERIVMLQIAGRAIETRQIFARTRPGPTFHLLRERDNPDFGKFTFYGAKLDLVAAPSRDVVGVVNDKDTGQPLAGATIEAEVLAGEPVSGWTNAYVRTATDARGRYRLSGLPIGENRIMALPPPSEPHMPSRSPAVTSLNEESITVDFELKRGVWIRGRVTDGASGEPLRAWVEYFAFLDNPNFKEASGLRGAQLVKIMTDADGRFAVRGLPGRGMVGVLAHHHEEYPRGVGAEKITDGRDANSAADSGTVTFRTEPHPCFATNFHALAEVNPAHDADAVEVDFALRAGPRIEGTLLDPSGKPLSGAMFAGENQMLAWRLPALEGPSFTVRNLEPNKPRRLHFYHTDRQLAGSMLLEGNETGPLSVRLEPWGTVMGRVLQSNGEPADKVTLLGALFSGQPPAAPGLLPDPHNRQTDDEGRFKIGGLAAGIPYALSASRRGTILGTVIEELQVAAGETKDLGDLTIHSSSDKPKAKTATERKGDRAAPTIDAAEPFQFAGNVVDPNDKPLAGAKIHIVYYTPNGIATKPRAETKADGSFEFTMNEKDFDAGFSNDPWKYAMLAAVAPGYGVGWAHAAAAEKTGRILAAVRASPNYRPDRAEDSTDSTIRLVADDVPIEGRVINLEGQGVAGAKVYVIELHANRENNLDGWLDAVENKKADYYQARQLVQGGFHGLFMQQQLAELFPPVTSDAEGRFRIQGIGRERIAHLQIEPPGCETQRVYARTRPGPALYVTEEADRSDDWPKLTYYGAQFDYAAAPSRAVVGVVRDKDTGKPLANVGVHSEKIAGHELQGWSQRYIQTTSDAEGRYRLEGLPIGSNRLIAIPPDGEPYLCIEATVETTPAAESATLDIELKRGVWIRGKVTDAASGEPLRASVEYFAFDTNPHLRPDGKRINFENPIHHSNGEGQFAVVGLPGRGMITVMANNADDYPRGAGADKIEGGRVDGRDEMFHTSPHYVVSMNGNALVEVNPEPGDEAIEQNITLDPGPRIEGTVLDPDGKPLAGSDCAGQHDINYWRTLNSDKFVVRHLRPDETRRLLFADKERKLAGTLLVKGGDQGPLAVKLEPAGTIKGRMLSEDGDPADQIFLYPGRAKDVPGVEGNTFPDAQRLHTEDNGHFTIPGLAPGVNYSVRASRGNRYLGTAFENVSVAAGETRDLGDVTLRKEPSPPATKPSEKKSAEQKPAEGKATPQVAPEADAGSQIQLAGKVVDPDGRPAAGAKIYLLQDVPAVTKPILMAQTKPDGTFALTVAKKEFNTDESSEPWLTAKLIATADGQGMAWALAASFESSGKLLENLPLHPNFSDRRDEVAADKTLHLVADDVSIEGRIIDLEGKPVAGVRVRVVQIDRAAQNNLDPWLEAVQDKDRAFHEAWNIVGISTGFNFYRQLEQFFPGIKTGADGRFRIRGVGRERIALLQMEGPEIETRQVSARTRSGPTVRVSDPRNPQMQARMYHGASFDEVAGPSRPVTGVVRDKDTGQPLAGVQVQAYRLAHIGVQPYPNTLFYTVTDKEGRYELRGLPVGENELLALAPRNEPYLVSARPAEVNTAADEIVVDFELKRGVWIRGRVTDAASGVPLRATVQYHVFLDNPRLREAPGFSDAFSLWFGTDVEGRFQIPGLPGRGIVGVRAKNYSDYPIGVGADGIEGRDDDSDALTFPTAPDFCMARNFHAIAGVNPAEDGGNSECNFALVPGRAVSGTVLDPKGAPLAGAMIAGAVEAQVWQPLAGAAFKIRNLQPEKSRCVQFYHAERRLAGTVLLSGDEKGPLTVKLESWATITGQVVDAQGDALGDVRISSAGVLDPQWGILPKRDAFEVDDEGRFTIEGLAPGVPYILGADKANRYLGVFIKDLKLAAGETKDLGDVAVKRSND
ncbi:MAG: hypothetical protein WD063_20680 [Pirellulales bacterium]